MPPDDDKTDKERLEEMLIQLAVGDAEPFDYHVAHMQMRALIPLIARFPAEKMLEGISRTHAVAPMLDPTLYRSGMNAVERDTIIIRGLLKAKEAVIEAFKHELAGMQ